MATDPMEHSGSVLRRVDRVEGIVSELTSTVTGLSTSMAEIRSDVRSFGESLRTLADGLKTKEQNAVTEEQAAKPNVVAIIAVLVTLIISMLGIAWTVSGNLARLDERDLQRDREMARIVQHIDKIDQRQWQMRQQ